MTYFSGLGLKVLPGILIFLEKSTNLSGVWPSKPYISMPRHISFFYIRWIILALIHALKWRLPHSCLDVSQQLPPGSSLNSPNSWKTLAWTWGDQKRNNPRRALWRNKSRYSSFKRKILALSGIGTSDLQISSLALHHLSSIDGIGLNLSPESNAMQGLVFCDSRTDFVFIYLFLTF